MQTKTFQWYIRTTRGSVCFFARNQAKQENRDSIQNCGLELSYRSIWALILTFDTVSHGWGIINKVVIIWHLTFPISNVDDVTQTDWASCDMYTSFNIGIRLPGLCETSLHSTLTIRNRVLLNVDAPFVSLPANRNQRRQRQKTISQWKCTIISLKLFNKRLHTTLLLDFHDIFFSIWHACLRVEPDQCWYSGAEKSSLGLGICDRLAGKKKSGIV